MSFAISASTARVAAPARASVERRSGVRAAARVAPAAKSARATAALKPRAHGVAALARGAVAARASARGGFQVLAGRFETERTYIMIKPDGVQRGYVRARHTTNPRARDRPTIARRGPLAAPFPDHRALGVDALYPSPQPSRRLTPPLSVSPPPRPPPRQVGEIIGRFEKKGNVLKGLKVFQTPKEVAEEHYQDLSEKPFFGDLVDYICSGPVVCMVWEGPGVVKSARKMIGATNPLESEPGTIRGDLAVEVGRNVIHGSDSVESAEREIALWFGGDDALMDWEPTVTPWVRE